MNYCTYDIIREQAWSTGLIQSLWKVAISAVLNGAQKLNIIFGSFRNFDLRLRTDSSLFHPHFKAVSISNEGTKPIAGFDTRQYVRGHAGGEYKCTA